MPRHYVRDASHLPDHDLVLRLPESPTLAFHVRHYVDRERHVVIAGELAGGPSPIVFAAPLAKQIAETVVPPECEFTMIAYGPQHPLSGKPHFREVTFELAGSTMPPSPAVFAGPEVSLPCFRDLDSAAVESMVGRPVLMFPYGLYTEALADGMHGQPAKRMLELLIEMGLACAQHGPSPSGAYCSVDPRCDAVQNQRARTWREPYEPRRRPADGAYIGVSTDRWDRIEFDEEGFRRRVPVFGIDSAGVAWGYGGAGPREAATSILADYLGFLPPPELRARFKDEIVACLPRSGFTLPVADLNVWWDRASTATRRGLVVVAGPASLDWPAGSANPIGGAIAHALQDSGFDVYEPARNAEAPGWTKNDHRLHGMLHASLRSALDCCSMIVVPHDGMGVMQGIEPTMALWYALGHRDVPCLVAHTHAEASGFAHHQRLGVAIEPISDSFPWDVEAVVAAVDRACAAYERLDTVEDAPRSSP